jgi:hypothetical protein
MARILIIDDGGRLSNVSDWGDSLQWEFFRV